MRRKTVIVWDVHYETNYESCFLWNFSYEKHIGHIKICVQLQYADKHQLGWNKKIVLSFQK